MKKSVPFAVLAVFSCLSGLVSAQNLISSTFKGSKTQAELIAQFGVPFIQYGAKYYAVRYTSPDALGNLDTLSGLLVTPDNAAKIYPRLVYQHGTSDCKTCVPSRYGQAGGSEGQAGLIYAGMGYIALLPDYVGFGDGRGFHPYVHAKTEASAALDLVRASAEWLSQNAFLANGQLFLTGYSQGGHASMAVHRELETNLTAEFSVTAAAHLSGPYSISGVMRGLILSQSEYFYPAYIPNSALSYQTVYGNLFTNLSEVFKPGYDALIGQFYQGNSSLSALNSALIQKLVAETGASVPRRMLHDNVLAAIENDPTFPINVALKDNDVFDWSPTAPTRIFYCMADDQVPFQNSLLARDTMLANGAANLAAADVDPTADHSGCVTPAFIQTLLFFAGFQQISVGVEEKWAAVDFQVSPNPASDFFTATGLPPGASVQLIDWNGRIVWAEKNVQTAGLSIRTGGLPAGIYLFQVTAADGRKGVKQVVVPRF